ncbi:MAG: hypothetical protein JKY26_01660 [Pseudomonas sp.]|nr:hypothetical protein [Pseudomonas sp.]
MKAFPSVEFSSSEPASNAPAYINKAQSFKVIAVSTGAQQWQGNIASAWERMPKARALWAFLNARGENETFPLVLPIHSTPNGAVNGAVNTTGALVTGTNTVTFTNYEPMAGDFFKFVGHSKVYQVEDATNNTAIFYPKLIKSVVVNELVVVTNVPFLVRRIGAVQSMPTNKKSLAKVKFKWEEVINA